MNIAEPRNSLSSFRAYDSIACVGGAEALHLNGVFVGWASFNYHASGNSAPSANWEYDLDAEAQSCLGLRFMQQVSAAGHLTRSAGSVPMFVARKARFRENPVKMHRRLKEFSTNRPDPQI
jgi:hypothetical protein